jgi:predicted N-formylglutamate amidohydrolase
MHGLADHPVCRLIEGRDRRILIVCDHASAAVPPGIALGVPEAEMRRHIASDLGAGPLAEALGERLDAPVFLATVSRLVVDFNRAPDAPGLVPEASDGTPVPGNRGLSPAAWAARLDLHRRFHAAFAKRIARQRPALLVSVHSFTPALRTAPAPRPWPIGILWNRDDRAAALALAALAREPDLGGPVGANQPYSGRELNYTMNRHAEANAIPYIGFEVRQDELADRAGIARWTAILARTVGHAIASRMPCG